MFTGLVQAVGKLERIDNEHVRILCDQSQAHLITTGLEIGDSVAVDGICLTATELMPLGFVAAVSPETLIRSTLGESLQGSKAVNLETSLRVGGKLGGHFVTGHVDGIGKLKTSARSASSWEMTFTAQSDRVSRYILRKGSIAINGISLTIADCDPEGSWFMVAVIPHTYAETNLSSLQPGSPVNLEGDILGKYVEKFLRYGKGEDSGPRVVMDAITPEFLVEHGYW